MNTQGTGTRITGLTRASFCPSRARRDSADQRPVKRPHSIAETGIAASAIKVPGTELVIVSEELSGPLRETNCGQDVSGAQTILLRAWLRQTRCRAQSSTVPHDSKGL